MKKFNTDALEGARKGPRKCYDNLRYIFKRTKERKEKKAKWRTS